MGWMEVRTDREIINAEEGTSAEIESPFRK